MKSFLGYSVQLETKSKGASRNLAGALFVSIFTIKKPEVLNANLGFFLGWICRQDDQSA